MERLFKIESGKVLLNCFSIIVLMVFSPVASFSQMIKNEAFDKTVDSYLSYTIPIISVEKACDTKEKYTFLDAREPSEYNVSHIQGAINVGYDHFSPQYVEKLDRDTPIIIYCSIGYRSEKIGEKLKKMGFKKVYNLYGSIFEWVNQGNPVVDSHNVKTNKVHGYNASWARWILNPDIEKIY